MDSFAVLTYPLPHSLDFRNGISSRIFFHPFLILAVASKSISRLLSLPTPLTLVCGLSIWPAAPAGSVHKSRGAVEEMWVLQRGNSGDGCDLASTLCKYDLSKG